MFAEKKSSLMLRGWTLREELLTYCHLESFTGIINASTGLAATQNIPNFS